MLESYSLYLHIPFCGHRCSYCDFNTYTTLFDLVQPYAEALCTEMRQVADAAGEPLPVHTIFFGGGTPSLMPAAAMKLILETAASVFALHPQAEITMEANPGTVDEAYLTAMRQLGVNRLSFGVQSAIGQELVLLERTHDFETAVTAVQTARQTGFDNLNLDLIYGVPGQTLESWRQSVEAVLALQPEHLSLYCLTIEPGTPMQRWLRNGRIQPPDPDLAADQYVLARQLLAKKGYVHYEISNWAKPGHTCEHNLTYWRNKPYLGFGAGAHGSAANVRYEIVKQPRVYIRRVQAGGEVLFPCSTAVARAHTVSREEAISDTIITQLRLLEEGLDLTAFAHRFGQPFATMFSNELEQLTALGLLKVQNGRLLLTENGRFLSNQVFYRFV